MGELAFKLFFNLLCLNHFKNQFLIFFAHMYIYIYIYIYIYFFTCF